MGAEHGCARAGDAPSRALARAAMLCWAIVCSQSAVGSAAAQSPECYLYPLGGTGGEELRCIDGLRIRAQAGAEYRLITRERDGRTDGVELKEKALLIDVNGRKRSHFQILTPHAIASVRGTEWAVDVTGEQSSVFVRRGLVEVRRPGDAAGVALEAGEGVDVKNDHEPLVVKRWAPERVRRLLARFGR